MTEDVLDTSDEEKLPWKMEPVPGWGEEVESWPWRSTGAGGWEKAGECIRCTHGMSVEKGGAYTEIESVDVAEDVLRTAEEGPLVIQAADGQKFFARCNCTEEHPGRSPGITRGCGQWAEIDPPPDDG
jgi:hypothetical protein